MLEIDSPIHFYYIAKNGQNIHKNSLFVFYIKKVPKNKHKTYLLNCHSAVSEKWAMYFMWNKFLKQMYFRFHWPPILQAMTLHFKH